MPLSESFLQELRLKTDIEDVISAYVSLKKRGSTSIGLCPFHNEKTPSFTVYHDTQSFYCFGCGAGGEAITFIRKIENLDYIDAVKLLAQRAGLQMPEDNFDDSLSKKRRRILEINRETARFFHSVLKSEQGRAGLDYFINRGLTPNTIKRFGLGYAPDSWNALFNHLKKCGFKPSEMLEAGVVRLSTKNQSSYYDTFRNRVMTPIIDVRGNVIAFGGRVLDDSKPKYINTNDTLVYKKTYEVFGLNLAKDSGKDSLILCEGYMDVIAMNQAGFTNAVAGCGTALTSEQVRLIGRYANEVILAYDADEAGQKALNKAISLFKQTDIKIKVPALVGGKDPDEIIKKYGRDKFKGMLDGASNDIEFHLLDLKKNYNFNSTQGKIDFLKEALKILADTSPIEQDIYMSRLSNELGVDKSSIKLQLDTLVRNKKRRQKTGEFNSIVNDSIKQSHKQTIEANASVRQLKAEERAIGLLIKYPSCYRLCEDFDSNLMTEGFSRKVFNLITERLKNNLDIELINLSSFLTDYEMSVLSRITAQNEISNDYKKEFKDCIEIIKTKSVERVVPTSELSDDEFRNLFKKNN
ncbi:MAG: DNA primase [Acetobacter sp.]|nr:DNA primase [Bacteroides sp.]MCM1340502.1 DNA primase [Acetobacter sp.]MCM1433242.1 DNA primase [Clostridiales bacterium]